MIAINSKGIEVQIQVIESWRNEQARLKMTAYNYTPRTLTNFNFLAAVTKTFDIALEPSSSPNIEPNEHATQFMTITRKVPNTAVRSFGIRSCHFIVDFRLV